MLSAIQSNICLKCSVETPKKDSWLHLY
jgi:hypothetical protein